jgi:hypothetical protein
LSLPKDSAEFVQIMNHHAVVSIENLGKLPAWASDGFCRGSTGGGFSKRKLYSDDEDVIYSFRRTFLMNGINIPGTRPDLLDRTILIELPRIPEDDRVEKVEVFRRFEEARPKIFGAMLDVLTAAMNLRGSIELTRLPRMADWCRWGCAVAEALGIDHRRFLDAYYKSIGYQHEEIVSAEPICQVLLRFMEDQSEWEGEPAELYRKLKGIGEEMDLTKEGFPKAPHTMTRKLNGLAHNLAEVGLKVTVSKGTRRIISIRKETSERIPAKASLPSKRLQTNQEADSEQDATSTLSADAENSAGGNAPDSLDKRRCDASDAFSGSPGGLNPDDCKFCDQFQQGWCRHATEKISTMRECPLGNEIPF